jgi:hypothetical protein
MSASALEDGHRELWRQWNSKFPDNISSIASYKVLGMFIYWTKIPFHLRR